MSEKMQPKVCDRCYTPGYPLYPHVRRDDETGEEATVYYCRRCDWEIIKALIVNQKGET